MLPIGQLLGIINFESILWGVIIWFSELHGNRAKQPDGRKRQIGGEGISVTVCLIANYVNLQAVSTWL